MNKNRNRYLFELQNEAMYLAFPTILFKNYNVKSSYYYICLFRSHKCNLSAWHFFICFSKNHLLSLAALLLFCSTVFLLPPLNVEAGKMLLLDKHITLWNTRIEYFLQWLFSYRKLGKMGAIIAKLWVRK